MKLIQVKITIDANTYNKWLDYQIGGEVMAASSLHEDLKKKVEEIGITEYLIETKIIEELKQKQ